MAQVMLRKMVVPLIKETKAERTKMEKTCPGGMGAMTKAAVRITEARVH